MDARPRFIESLTPARCRLILAAVLLLGFVSRVMYLTIDPPIGLSPDEAHYWDWSRQLDWSYYSKGPAVAYIIRFGCTLFGDTMLGVRFPALLFAIAISITTYWFTRRVFKSDRVALGAVLLCHVVPMFVAGSMLMTIDPPYFLCWGLATCFGYLATIEGKRWAWPAVGLCVGFGFLAKYAALLWFVCLLVFLISRRDQRKWLATGWPYLSLGIALLFTTPVLIWNAQHDWVTFGHVARSTTENQAKFNPMKIVANFGEMVGSQVGILNPIVAGLMVAAVVLASKRLRTPAPPPSGEAGWAPQPPVDSRLTAAPVVSPHPTSPGGGGEMHRAALAYLLAMGLTFFAIVAGVTLFKDIQPNWPVPTYFTLVPLAAWFIAVTWPRTKGWLVGAIVVGAVCVPFLHFSSSLYPLIKAPPRKWDPAARLMDGPDIGAAVTRELKQMRPETFVLCDKYQSAALTAFYVEGQPKTFTYGSYLKELKERDRLSQYDMWPDRSLEQSALLGRDAIFVGHDQPDLYAAFERVERLPSLPIERNGVTIRQQKLFRCYGFKGMQRPTDGLTKR